MSAADSQVVMTQAGGALAPPSQSPRGQAPTCGLEDPGVAQAVSLGKGFHHPVNLLGLSGEAEAPEKLPALERSWVQAPRLAEAPRCSLSPCQEAASNSLMASAAISGMAPH